MTARRSLLFMAAALLLTFCAPPSDEAWIRVVGFQRAGNETPISVYESDLHDGQTDLVDVLLENFSELVGGGGGEAVYVFRAEVEYDFAGLDLPRYEYPVTLGLPPPTPSLGEAAGSPGKGTLHNIPLVPNVLKGWLRDPANVPSDVIRAPFQVVSRISVRARTDEGTEVETSGDLGITFNYIPPPPEEEPEP